jgi:hypothetical protein
MKLEDPQFLTSAQDKDEWPSGRFTFRDESLLPTTKEAEDIPEVVRRRQREKSLLLLGIEPRSPLQ